MLNLNFWQRKPEAPPPVPVLTMVKAEGAPKVRELVDPSSLDGPRSIAQLDRMQLNGQLAHQATNSEGWDKAQRARDSITEQAHRAKMQDGQAQDLNRQYLQVALQESPGTAAVFSKDPELDEVRFQTRSTHGGVQYCKEYVRLGDYEIYATTAESGGKREALVYHYLPNGTIREEVSSASA